MLLNRQVLVLNQAYEPISVCSAKRALVLVFLGKAEIVEKSSYQIRTVTKYFIVPSVVRVFLYVHVPPKKIILTKKNILKRDRYICQYCGTGNRRMTVDHVIPRAYGGTDTWDNLVCACTKCNNIKGNRPPDKAGMKLLRKPRQPNHLTFIHHFVGIYDRCWKPYLFIGDRAIQWWETSTIPQ